MTAAILATIFATPPVTVAAWLAFRFLTAPPARHRLNPAAEQYRPRIVAEQEAAATAVIAVRDMVIPVPASRQQQPLPREVTALMDALAADDDTRVLDRVQ